MTRFITLLALLGLSLISSTCTPIEQAPPTSTSPVISTAPLQTPTAVPTASSGEIRPAAVAGSFYPADPAEMEALLDRFFASVQPADGTPIALIVPHAGWAYSGHVAAAAFKQIEGKTYDTVVIIGPNHNDPTFDAISVFAQGAFDTPGGPVPVDEWMAEEILSTNERIVFDRDVHKSEHSIEVQLPFLRRVCPDCSFVPILIGQPTPENLEILTDALIAVLSDKRALIIASSDLSHYPNYEDAVRVDTTSLAAMETMDDRTVSAVMAAQMAQGVPGLVTCACGHGPIIVAMRVAQALGADHVQILRYANSGDVSGDHSRVVGYGAVMFWRWRPAQLSPSSETELLTIARRSIKSYLQNGEVESFGPPADPELDRRLGAFVTLTSGGELRGCIGDVQGGAPLYQTVAQAAVDAAVNDPRFSPLSVDELDDLEIEVSILSPLKRVRDVYNEAEIQVGRHGLFVFYGQRTGVLLPQVPVAEGWDRRQYLQQLCFKAGLSASCWHQAALYTFTAQVLSD